MGRSDQELLQDGVPCLTFRKVAERFDSEMSKEAITPRKKWEQIVKDVVNETSGTPEEINRLMQLANEVYHLNFGTGLRARPPENLPKNAEIALQTRTSAAFSPFHRSHTAKASAATTPVVPEVSLPWCVDYWKRGLLGSLFDKDQPIGKCRRDYLKLRADYRAGSVDAEEMVAKKGEYQQKLE